MESFLYGLDGRNHKKEIGSVKICSFRRASHRNEGLSYDLYALFIANFLYVVYVIYIQLYLIFLNYRNETSLILM